MDFFLTIFLLCFILSCIISLIISVIKFTTKPYPEVKRFKEEEFFNDVRTRNKQKFPSVDDPPTLDLSIVVPAYNEEERLPPMLDEALEFLECRQKSNPTYSYEVIVVSDGSNDGTVAVTERYSAVYGSQKVRCLSLVQNRGKGGAVRLGVQSARGALILFADADGASKFEDVAKLENALHNLTQPTRHSSKEHMTDSMDHRERAIAIGSRAHLEKESLATRSVFRNILMYGFHFMVWLFTVKGIKDTQCGFKLFTRRAASDTFRSLHVNRWAFDVELLYIAQVMGIPIAEVPVRWTEIQGSKITPVLSWIQMGCDLALIWLKYKIGAWKIKGHNTD